jgi:hypothetical protein
MEIFDSLSTVIRNHVKQIAKTSGMPLNDETYELLASAWVDKQLCFEDAVSENNMDEVSFYSKDETKGALVMTYSGSLINIGPLVEGARRAEYTSIGLRTDVPSSALEDKSVLAGDVETDSAVEFSKGPIQQSSPVFKIAVTNEKLEAAEEEELLTRISQDVAEEFVEVNKTIIQ